MQKNKNLMKSVTSNDYVFSLVNKFLSVFIGVFSSVCVNRYLGPELKGQYAYLINIVNIAVIIAGLGFYQSYPNQHRNKMEDQLHKYMNVFFAQFLIYLVIAIALAFLYKQSAITCALMLVPVQVLMNQLIMVALVEFIKFKQKVQIVMLFVNFGVNLLLLLFFPSNVALALIALMIKDGGFVIAFLWKIKYIPNPFDISKDFMAMLVKFGLSAMISTLLLQLNYRVDILFLGNMATDYEVGLYSVGVTLAEYVWLIPDAFKEVLFARTAKSDSINEIVTCIKINSVITVCLILGMLIFGKLGIRILYGRDFVPAFGVTCILFLGIPAMVLFKITNPLYWANGKQMFFCMTLLASVIANVVLNVLLIPTFGKEGAAVASVVSYTLCGGTFYIKFIKDYHIKWLEPFVITKKDISELKKRINKRKEKS